MPSLRLAMADMHGESSQFTRTQRRATLIYEELGTDIWSCDYEVVACEFNTQL
jgi:hypothetical protein